MFMGFLHHLMLRLNTGKGDSNAAERLKKMKPGLDAHWMPHTKKSVIRDLVYSDRRIQVEEIAQVLGILYGSVSTILHDRLGMRNLTASWVPKSISDEQTISMQRRLVEAF